MDGMYDLLRTLVAFRTVDGDQTANATAVSFIDSYLKGRGLKPEKISLGGYQNLYVSTSGTKTPKVLLAAHVDVVPASDEMFDMQVDDTKVYGRGVFDMKFAIAAFLQVFEELKNELDDYDFGLMITPDEEVGSPNGTPRLIEMGYVPTGVCILPDGADEQNWNIETFSKGAWFAEFTARGVRAHGSRPWNGDNAIDKLLQFIIEVKELFPPVSREVSTINIGQITGGSAINQVPEEATVKFDMRFPSVEEKDRIHDAIMALVKKYNLIHEDSMMTNPTINDFGNPFIAQFAQSVKTVTGITPQPSNTPAGTDARFFTERGLPVVICVPPGGAHHSDNEWIGQKGFEQYKDVIVDYLKRTAKR